MAAMCLKLPVVGPFDPPRFFESLRTTSFGMPFTVIDSDIAVRSLQIQGEKVVVAVKYESNESGYALIAEISSKTNALQADTNWQEQLVHIFGCDDALSECYACLCQDSLFSPLIDHHFGYRMIRAPDIFETIFTVILGQQISVAAANAQRRRLLDYLAESISYRGEAVSVMVAAVQVADTPVETFRNLGISRQKSRYLRESARWAAEGRLQRSVLEKLSRNEAIDYLRGIPGVGNWTAEIVLMRGLGDMDIFPADDIGLQKIVQTLYRMERRPDAAELRDFSERWRGWRSYAALYLWMESMPQIKKRPG